MPDETSQPASETVAGRPELDRALGLPSALLYGLGVTIGAGIYVLIGPATGRAGMQAPFAFLIAAIAMAFTGASFAEFAGRRPVAAGEAAYVEAGLGSRTLSAMIGYLVMATGIVSAAAVSVGSAGYLGLFVSWPATLLIAIVVSAMGAITILGIRESVWFAGIMTLIEIGGLLILIAAGVITEPDLAARMPEMLPQGNWLAWSGVFSASLLAVFAFTGFENLANIAEEVKRPERVLPQAIFLTLAITTVLYVLVMWVALLAVPAETLAQSKAPLALVFEKQTGLSHTTISIIAIIATLNGVIVQFIMASRVLYGMACQGFAPVAFRRISPFTRTPVLATLVVIVATAAFAVFVSLEKLADLTSRITLVTFAFVNLSLVVLKWHGDAPLGPNAFVVPFWVPVVGFLMSVIFLFADVF